MKKKSYFGFFRYYLQASLVFVKLIFKIYMSLAIVIKVKAAVLVHLVTTIFFIIQMYDSELICLLIITESIHLKANYSLNLVVYFNQAIIITISHYLVKIIVISLLFLSIPLFQYSYLCRLL